MSWSSALYHGVVTHRRFRPKPHRLRYRMMFALLDLDEIEPLGRALRFFSTERFNLFSFRRGDHGAGGGASLRAEIEGRLADGGVDIGGGPIRLLTLPRMLGYVFNPLSVYFCHRPDGSLAAMLYEVTNTFGERHSYLIPAEPDADGQVRQDCAKTFFVSPFLDMDMHYAFTVQPPGDAISVTIKGSDAGGAMIAATFSGTREAISDRTLAFAFLRYPLLTLKVIVGIHYEALKIWSKGISLRRKPAPPVTPVTYVPGARP